MFIILITILTTSAARTTHSYINIDSNDKYRLSLPVFDLSFKLKNGNEDQLVSSYSYPKGHDLKSSDVMFPESNIHRRVDSEHGYRYPYHDSNDQWNRPTVTETAQLNNRFEDDTNPGAVDKIVEFKNGQYNRLQNHSKRNDTKSDKTTIKPSGTNLNAPRKFNIYRTNIYQNNSSVNQSSINPYQNSVKNLKHKNTYNSTNINIFTTESYNGTKGPNINLDIGGIYRAKTARDNEVKGVGDGDRWIWSDSETTTLVPLDDRAAFTANNCPAGTVRIGDTCVAED